MNANTTTIITITTTTTTTTTNFKMNVIAASYINVSITLAIHNV